jgi:hypothetical protein
MNGMYRNALIWPCSSAFWFINMYSCSVTTLSLPRTPQAAKYCLMPRDPHTLSQCCLSATAERMFLYKVGSDIKVQRGQVVFVDAPGLYSAEVCIRQQQTCSNSAVQCVGSQRAFTAPDRRRLRYLNISFVQIGHVRLQNTCISNSLFLAVRAAALHTAAF